MRRLTGEDAGFLSLELPIQPMNSMALAVLRPADGAVPRLDLDTVRRHLARRLDELPAFRWRVEPVPLGLHHPVWVEDAGFTLSHHVREYTLPPPGDDAELDRYYATLAGQCLDRDHPLWQLVLVHGLADGRQALVLRIHHCLMDGFATMATLKCIFSGEDYQPVPSAVPWRSEPAPRRRRLVAAALADQGRAIRRLPALIAKTRRNLAAVKAAPAGAPTVPKAFVDAPASRINQAFTSERRFAHTWLPVADARFVKTAAGVTMNDVALATVAGAIRSYLEVRDALPDRPLVASVPFGMEEPGAPRRTFGNRFSALTTSLATDVADPWARLQAISAVTAEAKRQLAIAGPELLPDWLEYVPPAVAGRVVRRQFRKRRQDPGRLEVNVVISNVRGPADPWWFDSVPVEDFFLTGPPNNGVGVNVVLMDQGERLVFSILTFADSVDAPGELADGLHRALAELVHQAQAGLG